MARSLAERAKDWRWWGEQVAHVLLGFIVAGICFWDSTHVEAFIAACSFAVLREGMQWPIDSWGDAAVDLLAMIAGAALVFAL